MGEFEGQDYTDNFEGYHYGSENFGDWGKGTDDENEICVPPNAVKECLEEIFQQSIADIKVVPYQSEPAYFIGEYSAWTGPNTINLAERDYPTCKSFWEDDLELTIHEYYHVVEQWNTGMTAVEYGVLSYFKEKDARDLPETMFNNIEIVLMVKSNFSLTQIHKVMHWNCEMEFCITL